MENSKETHYGVAVAGTAASTGTGCAVLFYSFTVYDGCDQTLKGSLLVGGFEAPKCKRRLDLSDPGLIGLVLNKTWVHLRGIYKSRHWCVSMC